MIQPTHVVVRDPFHPMLHRDVSNIALGSTLHELAPVIDKPFIMLVNGEPKLRADWSYTVQEEDIIATVVLPQDGGDSNPLAVVALIAVTMLAPGIGQAVAWSIAETTAISVGTFNAIAGAVTVGVGLAGAALVSAVLPQPKLPSPNQAQALASPSPTYNIAAQGNLARLDEAIPVQYGTVRFFPDFAAQPYTEYAGNEQYVFQLLCLGQGHYDVPADGIKIEDTDINNFDEIDYEIVGPTDTVTLFPTNVVTSIEVSGQELLNGSYVGPFTLNESGTDINAVAYDVVMPRGLYYVDANGILQNVSITFQFDVREINDAGTPIGVWTTVGTQVVTGKTTTPQRRSFRYTVALGRYEVRATRTDVKQTSTSYGHEGTWSAARGYLPETRDFGDVTLIALRMRASNNLSVRASRRINVQATRKIPIWNGSAWSGDTASSSIAWAIADMCKDSIYGAGLPDTRIDLAGLLTLDSTWTTRGDELNVRFDNSLSFWEALTKVCNVGRAKAFMQGGIVRVTRDQDETTPVAMYSMRNILRGSFSVEYLLPSDGTTDALDVKYWSNSRLSWRKVRAKLPGSPAGKPNSIELFGVTKRAQAFREGMYYVATNFYRRKLISFATEMEGFIPSIGDLIIVQHDMPAWGQFAEAVSWDGVGNVLEVDQDLTWAAGTEYVALRQKDGGVDGPYAVNQGVSVRHIVFSSAPTYTPYTGLDYEKTQIAFGTGEAWRQPAKVLSVKPRGLYRVEIECINEDPSVHTAEVGEIEPPIATSTLTTTYTEPLIANLVMKSTTDAVDKALLTWTPAPGAELYQIEMAAGLSPEDTGLVWTRVAETSASSYAVTAIYGSQTIIRVRGVGSMAVGPWVTLLYGESADYMWSADDTVYMWDAVTTTLMWRY